MLIRMLISGNTTPYKHKRSLALAALFCSLSYEVTEKANKMLSEFALRSNRPLLLITLTDFLGSLKAPELSQVYGLHHRGKLRPGTVQLHLSLLSSHLWEWACFTFTITITNWRLGSGFSDVHLHCSLIGNKG